MDTHVANGLISNSYLCLSENAEINIDNIVAAVTKLNVRILRLREEIVAFKNKNMISSVLTHNSLSLTPAGFNHSTKNGENPRTGERYEPRRNFKGDDSPSGTDLSARLSFAKRAREVKAANKAAVFKEDYPHDDKSIEDDERPNRSRVSEPSGTYQKSISDAEKSGKETDERPGNVRDTGDTNILLIANDEKLRKLNEHQNEVVSEGCSPANVFISKIKSKRISRGVQCVSSGCHRHAGRSLFNCFKSKSRIHNLAWKTKKKKFPMNKFDVGSRNKVNRSPGTTTISDKSRNVIKEEIKSTCDIDTKKEKFEKIGEEKIESIIYGNDKELQMQNMHADGEKSKDNDDLKYRKVKINLLAKLRLRRGLTRKNDSKTQQNELRHESRNQKEEIARLSYESKRVNGARKREDNLQSIKIIDRQIDSSNGRKTIATASVDRRSDVNKIKEKLDSCIAELNGIIGDAYAIFGNRRNAAKNND